VQKERACKENAAIDTTKAFFIELSFIFYHRNMQRSLPDSFDISNHLWVNAMLPAAVMRDLVGILFSEHHFYLRFAKSLFTEATIYSSLCKGFKLRQKV